MLNICLDAEMTKNPAFDDGPDDSAEPHGRTRPYRCRRLEASAAAAAGAARRAHRLRLLLDVNNLLVSRLEVSRSCSARCRNRCSASSARLGERGAHRSGDRPTEASGAGIHDRRRRSSPTSTSRSTVRPPASRFEPASRASSAKRGPRSGSSRMGRRRCRRLFRSLCCRAPSVTRGAARSGRSMSRASIRMHSSRDTSSTVLKQISHAGRDRDGKRSRVLQEIVGLKDHLAEEKVSPRGGDTAGA